LYQNAYSYQVAGEFEVNASGNFVDIYAPVAAIGDNFETFCVESDVIFNPGQTYTYVLSQQDSMGRVLSEGAAFLYYEFATGQLAGYDYTDPSVRLADAGELQVAIWELQGGQSFPGYPSYTTDPFYALATNTLGAAAFNPDDGMYDVDIMQLWDGPAPAQNQLVLTGTIPDAAWTSGLLALTCAGLVLLARCLNQRQPAPVGLKARG
jgi:hypothetical protein